MLTIGAAIAGAILEMADHENAIQFGLGASRAVFSSTCDRPAAAMGPMTPAAPRIDVGTSLFNIEFSQPMITVELMDVPPTCANRLSHLEPCAAHDADDGDHFKCKYTGSAGEIEMPAQKAYADWVWVLGVRSGLRTMINCTTPDSSGVMAATGYDGTLAYQDGATLELSIVFATNSTMSTELPYRGEPGMNVITYHGWQTPPMSPSPPTTPPPPALPCRGGFCARMDTVRSMGFGSDTYPFPHQFSNLCWSSERGDTMNANVFHSMCNDRGKTIYFMKVVYSNIEYNAGGYTRISWSGGGYTYDAEGGIFQVTPNVHRYAMPGQHSTNGVMYRDNNYGPTFGEGHDLHVSSNMRTGYVNLGHTYKCRVGNYGQSTCQYDLLGHYSSWSIEESEMWSEN